MRPKLHWSFKESWRRMIESLAPILQIVLGASSGYAIAHFGLGHAIPLFAVTVTITSLGFSRDARPRRVIETATGMVIGIALSEILLQLFGQGMWQIAVVLLICLLSARFISGSATFALTVGLQAMLVQILPAPEGGVFIRSAFGIEICDIARGVREDQFGTALSGTHTFGVEAQGVCIAGTFANEIDAHVRIRGEFQVRRVETHGCIVNLRPLA